MTDGEADRRHSRALEPELINDPTLKAEAEAANGLRQYDLAVQAVQTAIERQPFKLRLSLILSFQREALQGISSYAGNFRPGDVEIQHSRHVPSGSTSCPRTSGRFMRLREFQLGFIIACALGRLRNVAAQLDTSLR